MGCDIHLWIEYRKAADQPWELQTDSPCGWCYGTKVLSGDRPCFCNDGTPGRTVMNDHGGEYWGGGDAWHDRNYRLFSALAGVRRSEHDPEPSFPPRGIPEDATETYRHKLVWDGHSHSWLSLVEVHIALIEGVNYDYYRQFFKHTVEGQMEPLAEKYGDNNVRIVFFFDN